MRIRDMVPEDWPTVSKIYAEGIETGLASFEKIVPTFEKWDNAHLQVCRFVVVDSAGILGWVALSPVSGRCVYGGVAEVSIYIAAQSRGKGVGRNLMEYLINQSEKNGFWTLQSGIFPENTSSIRLHEKMGFRFIGKRERIAQRDGQWKDNLLFERRSAVVGVT